MADPRSLAAPSAAAPPAAGPSVADATAADATRADATDSGATGGAPPVPAAPVSVAAPPVMLEWSALRRGRRAVLAPAAVRVPAGAVVGLVGANGAGKSTLLMALAGVLATSCGRAAATADGRPIATVGYLPQRPALAPWLSVRGALALLGVDADATLATTPALRALAPLLDRRADALSGGQTQIVAIAGTLARGDPLVLLDEPFAGVDMRHRAALVTAVADHRRRSPASVLVLASHLAADLDALCDWLLVLGHGTVAYAGPREALPAAREEAHEDTHDEGEPVGAGRARSGVTMLERRLAALLG